MTLNATPYASFNGENVGSGITELVLPEASEMASYDSLHLELSLGCGDPLYEGCGEWDYLIYAYMCDEPVAENDAAAQSCQPAVAETMGQCVLDGVTQELECRTTEDCSSLAEDFSNVLSCDGYVEPIAADTLECDCDSPIGETSTTTQTCNAEGTGYDDCACSCGTEIGRWITSYARGGHWLMDSPHSGVSGWWHSAFALPATATKID